MAGTMTAFLLAAVMLQGSTTAAPPVKTDAAVKPVEKTAVVTPVEKTSAATPPPYLLAGDDVIGIAVVNFPNLSSQLVIPPDGKVTVPLLEPFSVLGKTTDEVAKLLTEKWKKYVINPSVSVSLTTRRKENVLLYGFVLRAGTVEYKAGKRITEALAEVGGAPLQGDLSQVTLTRKSGTKLTLDLSHPEKKSGTDVDVVLEAGDVIYVPERRTQISVVGEVNRPGSFDYKEDMTVLDALQQAGGIKETADLGAARLAKDGKDGPLDLDALLRHGDMVMNVRLAAGDRLVIPEIRNRTYVFGAVGRPGFYIFKPNDRILDALNGVGGPLADADIGKINVIHINKDKTKADVKQVDLNRFLKKGDLKFNEPLDAGDVLYVPYKKKAFQIQDLFGILSGFSLIDSTARLFSGH